MLSIPSAEEARKKVNNMESEMAKKMQEKVAKAIEDAINKFQFSCTIDGHLSNVLLRDLREKGYKVKSGSQKNEDLTSISW